MASTVPQGRLAALSVDELFSTYTIQHIRNLHSEYKLEVTQAREELHRLTGAKYRDLIKISEKIEKMSVLADSIDAKLVSHTYESPQYVEFGNNNYSRFDSLVRRREALEAREASAKTILNKILNELVGIDLKLESGILSQLLIYYSKVFHTIQSRFEKELESPATKCTFEALRSSFVAHLESKIESYTNLQSALTMESILHRSSSEADAIFVDDVYEEPLDDEAKKLTLPNGRSIQTVNVLVAYYIMCCSQLESLLDVAKKVVELRYTYLDRLLREAARSAKCINYFPVFAFVESTCTLIDRYFTDKHYNELLKGIEQNTNWEISDLIGYHGWFEKTGVSVPVGDLSLIQHKELSAYCAWHSTSFLDIVASLSDETEEETRSMTLARNLYELLRAFRGTISMCASHGKDCYTVVIMAKQSLEEVLNRTFVIQKELCLLLTRKISGLNLRPQGTSNGFSNKSNVFSHDFVSVVETDVDAYLEALSHATNDPSSESHKAISEWFASQQRMLELFDVRKDGLAQQTLSVLESWTASPLGGITKKSYCESVAALHKDVAKDIKAQLQTVVSQLCSSESLASCTSPTELLAYLGVLVHLSREIKQIELSELLADIAPRIKAGIRSAWEAVFSTMGEELKLIDSLSNCLNDVNEEFQPRPSISFCSHIYGFSCRLLKTERLTNCEFTRLYDDEDARSIFVEVKQKWVAEMVAPAVLHALKNHETEGPDNEPVDLKQSLANAAFLLKFTNSTEQLTDIGNVSSADFDHIMHGVNEYYKSSRDMYLPLLLH